MHGFLVLFSYRHLKFYNLLMVSRKIYRKKSKLEFAELHFVSGPAVNPLESAIICIQDFLVSKGEYFQLNNHFVAKHQDGVFTRKGDIS